MFRKLVAIEPVSLIPSAEKALHSYADEVVMYPDVPAGDDEIVARIGRVWTTSGQLVQVRDK